MITIFSDPHLGCNRTSHTTPASRERLKLAIYEQANRVTGDTFSICLGDLFDQFWGDAITLKQGKTIWDNCSLVLTGNHDRSNRVNAVSALEFIEHFEFEEGDEVIVDEPSVVKYAGFLDLNRPAQWIHHKMTQALFDESLVLVEPIGGLLFLHCNYDSGFATDESSLNLTKEQAEILLTKVDKIFIGHEHIPNEHFGGRLILTGNIHPTSFSDISDKYVYHVDKDLNVTKELIWDKERYHLEMNYECIISVKFFAEACQFIEITGQAEASELPAIARAVANLWKTCPDALMIKNSVTCVKQELVVCEPVKLADTLTTISNELRETKLFPIWMDYLGRIE